MPDVKQDNDQQTDKRTGLSRADILDMRHPRWTDKQRAFARNYLRHHNAGRAAKAAGYCPNLESLPRIARYLMSRPHIAEYIDLRIAEDAARYNMDAQAVMAEIVLSLGGQPRRSLFIAAGAVGVLCPFIQPFIIGPLLYGRSLYIVWFDLLETGSRLFGIDTGAVFIIVAGLLLVYLAIGAVAGWTGWRLGQQLQKRMGGSIEAASHANQS